MRTYLRVHFKERMTNVESMCLHLLWCIVFDPRSEDGVGFNTHDNTLTYQGGADSIGRMHQMLIDRNWTDAKFDENRNFPEVQAVMEYMVARNWGTFDERLNGLLAKIDRIDPPITV